MDIGISALQHAINGRPWSGARAARIAGLGLLAAMFAGLAGRLLAFPLHKDEHLFVSAAALLGRGDLYRDLGYNHLPNLPLLLGGLYALTGTEHYLLTGRLLILAFWGLAVLSVWLLAKRLQLGTLGFVTGSVLLLGNVLLLREPGMLASNNFIPIPLFLLAFYFLLKAMQPSAPSAAAAFAAGLIGALAAGFKANYVFLAPAFALVTLLAPAQRPLGQRITHAFLPLAAGGILGGIPTLFYLIRDPGLFFAHTLRYFTELQVAYWGVSSEPQVASLAQKIVLAEQLWFADGSLLALTAILALALIPLVYGGPRAFASRFNHWSLGFMAALALCGFLVAFVPSPSFDQYFAIPLPFLITGLLLVMARLLPAEREQALPLLGAVFVLVLVTSASRILPDLPRLAHPASWTGVKLHKDARAHVAQAGLAPGAPVATLSPVYVLEGGLLPLPEFFAGPFVYRVAEFIAPEDAPYYRTTSPRDLDAFLDAARPAAIVISDSPLEQDFADYAAARAFREVRSTGEAEGYSHMRILVRP